MNILKYIEKQADNNCIIYTQGDNSYGKIY